MEEEVSRRLITFSARDYVLNAARLIKNEWSSIPCLNLSIKGF
jgi:hypothetical protein